MAFQSEIAGSQIDGARDYQEDAFLITHLTDADSHPSALIIVADGMGGHAAGNVASNMAVQAFNKCITTQYPTENLSEALNESLIRANGAITETVKETPALDGMGCTIVGVVVEKNYLWWVSVGDSHLYLLRDRKLTKLNADHSYGGFLDRMEAAGTPIEAEPGLSRNMLMSAVTGTDLAEIDCPSEPITLQHNDKLVICTDGLDTLSEGKIIQYSDWADTSKECADALMDAVEDAAMPRQDNTTAVVVKIIDDGVSEAVVVEEEKDDDDITAPGAAKADDTLEEKITEQETPADVSTKVAAKSSEKSKTGLVIGIAAGALIALIAGAYFMFSSSELDEISDQISTELGEINDQISTEIDKLSDQTPSEEMILEDEEVIEETPLAKPESTTKTDEKEVVKVEETAPEPAVKKDDVIVDTKPEPAPISAPVSKKEFQDSLKGGGKAPVMVVIPAGTFEMGSPLSSRFVDERPRHTVKIKSFAMSKYEVTFAEYGKFAKATDRKSPDDLHMNRKSHPVIYVKWDDAYNYAKWLTKQTGKKYRLLSESEWEYAASTGSNSSFWWGFNEEAGKAHCFGCGTDLDPRKPSKVGGFEANKFGLHDTAGNVTEWVQDCWHKNYKDAPTDGEVWEGGDCAYRVVRGGGYISPQQSIRSAKRDKLKSNSGYDHVGIRIARELD